MTIVIFFYKKPNNCFVALKKLLIFGATRSHDDIVHFSVKNSTYNNEVTILITGSLKITDMGGRQGATMFRCCLSS
jgi:hypothetical protein